MRSLVQYTAGLFARVGRSARFNRLDMKDRARAAGTADGLQIYQACCAELLNLQIAWAFGVLLCYNAGHMGDDFRGGTAVSIRDMEALYQAIGQELFDMAGDPFVAGYIQVELADDFGSVGVYVDRGDGRYYYLFDDQAQLFILFSQLRELSILNELGRWSQATFILQADGSFTLAYGHADVSDLGQSSARRALWIQQMFGDNAVICWPHNRLS